MFFSFSFVSWGQIFGVFFAPFPEEEISDYIAHGPIIRVLTAVEPECPALAQKRLDKLYGTFDIEPDSELPKNTKKGRGLMKEFSAYILENRINFPVGIGVFPFTRYANLVS